MVSISPYDQKCPLCTLVLKSYATLSWPTFLYGNLCLVIGASIFLLENEMQDPFVNFQNNCLIYIAYYSLMNMTDIW